MPNIFSEIKLFLEFIYYRSYVFYSGFRYELWPEGCAWYVVSICLGMNILSVVYLTEEILEVEIIQISYMWPFAIFICFFCYKWLLASTRKNKKKQSEVFQNIE